MRINESTCIVGDSIFVPESDNTNPPISSSDEQASTDSLADDATAMDRQNNTAICDTTHADTTCKVVVLVPYRREHVDCYHGWMLNEDLRAATASDLLTLDEELEMQTSWHVDDDKCTFIVLAVPGKVKPGSDCDGGNRQEWVMSEEVQDGRYQALERDDDFVAQHVCDMVGDINLFLSTIEPPDDDDEDDDTNGHNYGSKVAAHQSTINNAHQQTVSPITAYKQGEINVMVAETWARRLGVASQAILLMMIYGARHLGIARFVAKISEDNKASIKLFERLGFHQSACVECFQEVEMEVKAESPADLLSKLQTLYNRTDLRTFQCSAESAINRVA
jgi:RimJ/RimL family protein N-acetyltransferase